MSRRIAFGAALSFLFAFSAAAGIAPREIHKTLPLAADGRVEIKAFKGSITVTGGGTSDVDVTARIEPDGDDDDQERAVRDTDVKIEGGGGEVRITSDYDRVKSHHRWHFLRFFSSSLTLPFVRYTIRVPEGARVVVEDFKSSITLTNLASDVKLETYKGDARLEKCGGAVRIETYKGSVTFDLPDPKHDVDLTTYKGRIEVRLDKQARFTLDAEMGRRGDLTSDFEVASRSSRHGAETVRGSVNGGGPRIRFSTHKGELALRTR